MKLTKMAIAAAVLIASAATAAEKPKQVAAQLAKPAPVAQRPQGTPQMPPPEALIIMIRSSLVALSQANITNDYSVLSALGSPGFQRVNPPERLAQNFAAFRANAIDMNPVVFVTPQLTAQPTIQNGKLRLVGNFPTQPMQVNYDLQFEPSGGVWKLFGLTVNLTQSAPPPGQGR